MMRVGMAVAALGERDAGKSRLAARRGGGVAFLAGHLRVKARQRKSRLAVIEFLRPLPVHEIVALEAILPQLSFMWVLVAIDAILNQSEERPVQILHLDLRPLGFANVRRRVALVAVSLRVFVLQRVAGLSVIEPL